MNILKIATCYPNLFMQVVNTFKAETADPFRKVIVNSTEIDYVAKPSKREPTSKLLLHKDGKPWTVLTFDMSEITRLRTETVGKPVSIKEFIETLVSQAKTRFQDRSVKLVYEGVAKKAIIECVKEGIIDSVKNVVKPTILSADIMNLAPDLSISIEDDDSVESMADLRAKLAEAQSKAQQNLQVDIDDTVEPTASEPKKRGRGRPKKQTT